MDFDEENSFMGKDNETVWMKEKFRPNVSSCKKYYYKTP